MGDTGLEHFPENPSQVTNNKELSNAPPETLKQARVQNPVHDTVFCPELQQIIDHWDSLPEHIKAAIKALIQTHITEKK